ncbi:hypothetical protein JCM10450v2_008289 [Rhodotorula kratochvilovae]
MPLLSLPPELFPLVCASLPAADRARLSLASHRTRALVQPELYRDVQFAWVHVLTRQDSQAHRDARERICAAVASLARDADRCAHLRRFVCGEYTGWLDVATGHLLAQVLTQAPLLDEVAIVQEDDGTPFDPRLTPFPGIAPVWDALRKVPNLRRLRTQYGPNVQLNLHELTTLRELSMGMYYVDTQKDGTLPDSLEVLSLEYVLAFTIEWFRPSLFSHLQSLALADLTPAAVATVQRAIETYTATSLPSRLTHLRLDLHSSRVEHWNELLLLNLLRSFVSIAASIIRLEILSTPDIAPLGGAATTDSRALEAAEAIADGFPRLQRLQFMVSDTETVRVYRPTDYETLDAELRVLARCKDLRYLETNRTYMPPAGSFPPPPHLPSQSDVDAATALAIPLHAPRFFALLPTVQHVVFSPDVRRSGPTVWIQAPALDLALLAPAAVCEGDVLRALPTPSPGVSLDKGRQLASV